MLQTEIENLILCSDCGNALKKTSSYSVLCSTCGNIQVVSQSQKRTKPTKQEDDRKFAPANAESSIECRNIQTKYQSEWEFWLAVTANFHDPVYHSAYLSRMLLFSNLEKALERYKRHLSVMILSNRDRAEAEICDEMISRIQRLSLSFITAKKHDGFFYGVNEKYYLFFHEAIQKSRTLKTGWIFLGFFLTYYILRRFLDAS